MLSLPTDLYWRKKAKNVFVEIIEEDTLHLI